MIFRKYVVVGDLERRSMEVLSLEIVGWDHGRNRRSNETYPFKSIESLEALGFLDCQAIDILMPRAWRWQLKLDSNMIGE